MNSNYPALASYLQQIPGYNCFPDVSCCQYSGSLETVEQWCDTGDHVCTQSQPYLPVPSFPIDSAITPRVTTSTDNRECPICSELLHRKQERDRHLLNHVPYFIHCPLLNCAWRGNRADLFKKHWAQEDHWAYHEHYGHAPKRSEIETYDPWEILNKITKGIVTPSEGEDQAVLLVQVKGYELQKPSLWKNPWGRTRKQDSSRR